MKKTIKEISPFNNIESNNKAIYIIKIMLKTFFVYGISLIIASIFVLLSQMLLGYEPSGENMPFDVMLLFKYYGYVVTIILFAIFIKKFEKMDFEEIGINKKLKDFFKGIIIGIIALLIIIILLMLFKQITFSGINSKVNYGMILLFIGAFLIQSSSEEIICRGYLLNKLKKKINVYFSVFLSFIIFSVLHFFELFNDGVLLGIVGILNLFLISVIWSILVLKSKNLYSAIGFHFIWNFSLFSLIGLNLSGVESSNSLLKFNSNNSFITGMSYGIESSFVTTIILCVILIIISSFHRKIDKKS